MCSVVCVCVVCACARARVCLRVDIFDNFFIIVLLLITQNGQRVCVRRPMCDANSVVKKWLAECVVLHRLRRFSTNCYHSHCTYQGRAVTLQVLYTRNLRHLANVSQ